LPIGDWRLSDPLTIERLEPLGIGLGDWVIAASGDPSLVDASSPTDADTPPGTRDGEWRNRQSAIPQSKAQCPNHQSPNESPDHQSAIVNGQPLGQAAQW